ncbi:MAG: carboxypeptidase regulatory-like domain-containing protein [Vicinamibacterales bacterium]
MPRVRARHTLLFVTLWMAGCSGSDTAPSPTPTPTPTPTPSTPTVSAVTITSRQTSAAVYQLEARAQLSDGTSRDVTADAQWALSNSAIAQVSENGVLRALASGSVDVRATYESVTGTATLEVAVPFFSVAGTVTEAPPASRLLEGVRIDVTAGLDEGAFTYSDDRGRFTLSGLRPGEIALSVNRNGYQPWTQRFTLEESFADLSIVLHPAPSGSVR